MKKPRLLKTALIITSILLKTAKFAENQNTSDTKTEKEVTHQARINANISLKDSPINKVKKTCKISSYIAKTKKT